MEETNRAVRARVRARIFAGPHPGQARLLANLSGNRPPFTPEWTVSGSYSHTFRTALHSGERFDVTAFVRNIEDERTLRYGAFAFVAGQTVYRYNFSEPRTFGLTATVHF